MKALFGVGLTDAPPGLAQGLRLAVSDIRGYRSELAGRGVAVSAIRHAWVSQERNHRPT